MTDFEHDHFSRAVAALGITDAVGQLRVDIRDMRGEMSGLRDDLAETRETVAEMKGRQAGDSHHTETSWRWRSHLVEVAAAAGVILGAFAALHP